MTGEQALRVMSRVFARRRDSLLAEAAKLGSFTDKGYILAQQVNEYSYLIKELEGERILASLCEAPRV